MYVYLMEALTYAPVIVYTTEYFTAQIKTFQHLFTLKLKLYLCEIDEETPSTILLANKLQTLCSKIAQTNIQN